MTNSLTVMNCLLIMDIGRNGEHTGCDLPSTVRVRSVSTEFRVNMGKDFRQK